MKFSRRSFITAALGLFQMSYLLLRPGRLLARLNDAAKSPMPQTESGPGLHFLLLGDWGRQGKHHQSDVAAQMARAASERRCRFIVSVGDNFYEDGVSSVNDPQWQTSFENIYRAPSLQVPWYVILGNHDYRGEPEAQLQYANTRPRWRMPARYYTAKEPLPGDATVEFFFIDTSPFLQSYHWEPEYRVQVSKQKTEPQIAWLDQALGASKAAWKIVIGHHPIFSGGEHGDTAELVRDINPLLKKHDVFVYINGHDHDLQHIVRDEINYFTTGAGSQVRLPGATKGTLFDRGIPGFMAVALTPAAMKVDFIDYAGKTLYHTEVRNRVVASV